MHYQLPLCCLVNQSIHRQGFLGIQQNYFGGSSMEEGFGNTVLETHAAYSLLLSILPGYFGPEPSWFHCLSVTHLQSYALYSF